MNDGNTNISGNTRFSGFPAATTQRPWAFAGLSRTRDASSSRKDPLVCRRNISFSLIGGANGPQRGARGEGISFGCWRLR